MANRESGPKDPATPGRDGEFIEDIAGILESVPVQEIDFTPHGSGIPCRGKCTVVVLAYDAPPGAAPSDISDVAGIVETWREPTGVERRREWAFAPDSVTVTEIGPDGSRRVRRYVLQDDVMFEIWQDEEGAWHRRQLAPTEEPEVPDPPEDLDRRVSDFMEANPRIVRTDGCPRPKCECAGLVEDTTQRSLSMITFSFVVEREGRRLSFTVAIDGVRSVFHGECRRRRLEVQVHEF